MPTDPTRPNPVESPERERDRLDAALARLDARLRRVSNADEDRELLALATRFLRRYHRTLLAVETGPFDATQRRMIVAGTIQGPFDGPVAQA